jgi:hypothetical protein
MAENALELRYSAAAKARDVVYCFIVGMVLGSIAAAFLKDRLLDDPGCAFVLACWVGATAPPVFVAGLWRWGRRGWVDADGVGYAESARGPVRQLAWREVEEICCVGREGAELRGGDVRIRWTDDFAPLGRTWALIGRYRGATLGADLRRRFLAGETLRFRGPESPAANLARAGILVAFAFPVVVGLGLLIVEALQPRGWGMGDDGLGCLGILLLAILTVLGVILFRLRERCGWVEVSPAGLTVQGATRIDCRWEDLQAMGTGDRHGLRFRSAQGARFGIPRDVANFVFLEELIRSRKER